MSSELSTPSGRTLPAEIGGYKIIARLSRGGMGEVLLGQKESHGFTKKVAIKVVLPHVAEDEEFRTLFFDEARLMARMSDAHITQVFDFGIDDGHLFMVMEYVDGLSVEAVFRAHQKRESRMPPELAGLAIAQAARGLHSAHTLTDDAGAHLGVVHRDVSPQNLIITWRGTTKVLDFGIARSNVRRGHTQIGVVRGKPGYMAPEQAKNDPLDARTDIFQLGIVLFELLAGRELYARANMYESIAAAIEEPVPDITAEVAGIDSGYQDVLGAALAKSPEQRFRTADAMARALDAVVARAGYPVTEGALGDHLRALRPKPATDPRATLTDTARGDIAASVGSAVQTESGRAAGMNTVTLAAPQQAAADAARVTAALPTGEERVTVDVGASAPLRPAVETSQPNVKTFAADVTLAAARPGPVTNAFVTEQRRGRQRGLAAAAALLFVLLVGGGAYWLASSDPTDGLVEVSPPLALVDAGGALAEARNDEADAGAVALAKASEQADAPDERATAPVEDATEQPRRRRRRRGAPRSSTPEADVGGTDAPSGAPEVHPAASKVAHKTDTPPATEPAPVPPATRAAPAAIGTLFVVSEPYAHIFVDGVRMGDTPKMLKLDVGSHRLKLVDPQNGSAWHTQTVEVNEGRNPAVKAKKPRG